MRHFTKPLGMLVVAAALLASFVPRAHAQQPWGPGYISAWPDSLNLTATVGSSANGRIVIVEDTSNGVIPQVVHLSVTGSSQFRLADSVIDLTSTGYAETAVEYTPTATTSVTGTIQLVGDSNTVSLKLHGTPTPFTPQIRFQIGNYSELIRNQQSCLGFGVYNPNPGAIMLTQIHLTSYTSAGTGWSIENETSLPVSLGSHDTLTLGELCALTVKDTPIFGTLAIDYTYGDSTYSARITVDGSPQPPLQPQLKLGSYAGLNKYQPTCDDFGIYNPNLDTIRITNVALLDNWPHSGSWSIENLLPMDIIVPDTSTITLGQLCAMLGDSAEMHGELQIYYYVRDNYIRAVEFSLAGVGPHETACVTADGVYSDGIPAGESRTDYFDLTNNTTSSVELNSASITGVDYGQFSIASPAFPVTLAAGASTKVEITGAIPSDPAKDNYYASFVANVSGTSSDGIPCNSVNVPLHAEFYDPDADTITLNVPPGSNTLSISAHKTRTQHRVLIHNAGTNKLLLQSLVASSEDSSVHVFFVGTEGDTLSIEDTVGSGSNLLWPYISMELEAPDTGTYNIDLTLTYTTQRAHQKSATPASSNSLTYTVVAHRLPPLSAGVSEPNAPAPVAFTLSPNPARGEVTIGLPDAGSSNVEIYDVLGNLVFQGTEYGSFLWDGAASGSPVANGTYIVRVSQGSRVSSQRLIFVR